MSMQEWDRFEKLLDAHLVQQELPAWLASKRWFGAKTRTIASVEVTGWAAFSTSAAILFVLVSYIDGEPDTYQVPLAVSQGTVGTPGPILDDAVDDEDFRQRLLRLMEYDESLALSADGVLHGHCSNLFAGVRGAQPIPAHIGNAEQSNTSILFGNTMILKLFRRLQPGENPDVEIGRFLTEVAHFPHIPKLLGEISLERPGKEKTSTAMLQELVASDGDGWQWTLLELFQCGGSITPSYLEAVSLLGRRTAEMHLALATDTSDEAFRSEPLTTAELGADADRIRSQIDRALNALEQAMPRLQPDGAANAAILLSNRGELQGQVDAVLNQQPSGKIIRIHGDYHLGQVLRTSDDFVILDFKGEPAASLAERRKKRSPLKDVAGMLRSFSYAAWTGLENQPTLRQSWQDAVASNFLDAYSQTVSVHPDLLPRAPLADSLLRAYLLEKACYELLYELNNRPAWVGIPIAGILALLAPG